MKKLSLVAILIQYLKEKSPKIIHGGQMEKVAQSYGYEAETGKRRLREITNPLHDNYNSHIKKSFENGCVQFRYAK